MTTPGHRRVINVAAMIAVFCVLGLYVHFRFLRQDPVANEPARCTPPGVQAGLPPAGQDPPAREAPPVAGGTNGGPKPSEAATAPNELCTVELRFVDDAGAPVGEVKYCYWLFGRVQRSGFEQSDARGSAVLRATEGSTCELEVTNWKGRIEEGGKKVYSIVEDYPHYSERITFSFQRTPQQIQVRVGSATTIRLRITFDDGELFEGSACLTCGRWSRWFPSEARQPIELHGVVCDRTTELTVFPTRIGYESAEYDISPEELRRGGILEYVVPKAANARGAIAVNCSGADYDSFVLLLRKRNTLFADIIASRGERTGSGLLQSQRLDPGSYEATLLWRRQVGARDLDQYEHWVWEYWVWSVPDVEVKGGSILTLTPEFILAGSLEVEVLADDGKPLKNALVQVGNQPPVWIDNPRAIPGTAAVSDIHGMARIQGLPPGRVDFSVEARGFEPVRLSADIAGGGVARLSPVRLLPAQGAITLNLLSRVPTWKYSVSLKAGAHAGYFLRDVTVENGQVRITGLPVGRTYTVLVCPLPGGGTVKQLAVALSVENPDRTIAIDVSDLERN